MSTLSSSFAKLAAGLTDSEPPQPSTPHPLHAFPDARPMARLDVLVVYISETGVSKAFAEELTDTLLSEDMGARAVYCRPASALEIDEVVSQDHLVIFASTLDGLPPPSSAPFVDALLCETSCSRHLRFAVFGCGDSSYGSQFNITAKTINLHLGKIGATRITPLGLGDEDADGGCDAAYATWRHSLLCELLKEFGHEDDVKAIPAWEAQAPLTPKPNPKPKPIQSEGHGRGHDQGRGQKHCHISHSYDYAQSIVQYFDSLEATGAGAGANSLGGSLSGVLGSVHASALARIRRADIAEAADLLGLDLDLDMLYDAPLEVDIDLSSSASDHGHDSSSSSVAEARRWRDHKLVRGAIERWIGRHAASASVTVGRPTNRFWRAVQQWWFSYLACWAEHPISPGRLGRVLGSRLLPAAQNDANVAALVTLIDAMYGVHGGGDVDQVVTLSVSESGPDDDENEVRFADLFLDALRQWRPRSGSKRPHIAIRLSSPPRTPTSLIWKCLEIAAANEALVTWVALPVERMSILGLGLGLGLGLAGLVGVRLGASPDVGADMNQARRLASAAIETMELDGWVPILPMAKWTWRGRERGRERERECPVVRAQVQAGVDDTDLLGSVKRAAAADGGGLTIIECLCGSASASAVPARFDLRDARNAVAMVGGMGPFNGGVGTRTTCDLTIDSSPSSSLMRRCGDVLSLIREQFCFGVVDLTVRVGVGVGAEAEAEALGRVRPQPQPSTDPRPRPRPRPKKEAQPRSAVPHLPILPRTVQQESSRSRSRRGEAIEKGGNSYSASATSEFDSLVGMLL